MLAQVDRKCEVMPINGSLRKALLEGSAIVWANYSGLNYHVLVRNPVGSEWKYSTHVLDGKISGSVKNQDLRFKAAKGDQFIRANCYDMNKADALRNARKEFEEDRIYHRNLKR